jgi:hypothetical protein
MCLLTGVAAVLAAFPGLTAAELVRALLLGHVTLQCGGNMQVA